MPASSLFLSLLAGTTLTLAFPLQHRRQNGSCPPLHVFGARETTASPGYGSAGGLVNNILAGTAGATAEAIDYPASGDNPPYAESRDTGVAAVNSQVSSFAEQCPDAEIVLVGYSQGAEIFDLALCQGSDIASYNIKAAIFFGAPTFNAGESYDIGTCATGGFDITLGGTTCGAFDRSVQSYCDAGDPYCCDGNDANVHNGYEAEYGSDALSFVESQLGGNSAGSSITTADDTAECEVKWIKL